MQLDTDVNWCCDARHTLLNTFLNTTSSMKLTTVPLWGSMTATHLTGPYGPACIVHEKHYEAWGTGHAYTLIQLRVTQNFMYYYTVNCILLCYSGLTFHSQEMNVLLESKSNHTCISEWFSVSTSVPRHVAVFHVYKSCGRLDDLK